MLKKIVKKTFSKLGYDIRPKTMIPFGIKYPDDLAFLAKAKKESINTIFDVGANVGQTVFKLQPYFPKATIYCFEPSHKTFNKLLNNTKNNTKNFNIALGEQPGETKMLDIQEKSPTNSLLTPLDKQEQTNGELITVTIDTIDNFVQEHNITKIDFLKIDVEGYEMNVLKGAERFLTEQNIDYILAECTFYNRPAGKQTWSNFIDIYNYLSLFNYRVATIYTQAIDEYGYIFGDVLFLKTADTQSKMFSRSPFG